MTTKTSILAVDDDEFNRIMLEGLLADDFQLTTVNDGLECLQSVSENKPDLILLDVKMSGLDGLETCRRLRLNYDNIHLPILFVSGMTTDEDRLEGYKAGGDDYITKPYNENELLSKIKLALENSKASIALEKSNSESKKVAVNAMNNSYEIGHILSFIQASFSCNDYQSLKQALFDNLKTFSLPCSLLLKQQDKKAFYFDDNISRPLEISALNKVNSMDKRIVEFGNRAIFNSSKATLLVRKMPIDDADLCGRLKDHLCILIEALDSRINAINSNKMREQKQRVLSQVLSNTKKNLQEIEQEQMQQQIEISGIISAIGSQLEESFIHLGLEEQQEKIIIDIVSQAENKSDDIFSRGIDLETRFGIIIHTLENTK